MEIAGLNFESFEYARTRLYSDNDVCRAIVEQSADVRAQILNQASMEFLNEKGKMEILRAYGLGLLLLKQAQEVLLHDTKNYFTLEVTSLSSGYPSLTDLTQALESLVYVLCKFELKQDAEELIQHFGASLIQVFDLEIELIKDVLTTAQATLEKPAEYFQRNNAQFKPNSLSSYVLGKISELIKPIIAENYEDVMAYVKNTYWPDWESFCVARICVRMANCGHLKEAVAFGRRLEFEGIYKEIIDYIVVVGIEQGKELDELEECIQSTPQPIDQDVRYMEILRSYLKRNELQKAEQMVDKISLQSGLRSIAYSKIAQIKWKTGSH